MKIEPVSPQRYTEWREHFGRYREALGDPVDDAVAEVIWSWLLARTHGVEGLLALDEADRLAGFAHFRPFPRTLHGNEACFLDDLWVDEPQRGTGLAETLIDAVCALARERGWTEVRWVAEEHNARARRVYERVATDGRLITYRIRFGA
ncbi:MAG: GNAT family N-acetyltransferase [Alphaproteobacteria bacterium]|nr:GNAT family N-acetyltransferase [Alphaproteobacteria bacterium]